MKKKIPLFSILVIFMLLIISFATAVKTTDVEKKESPLYGIRIRRAINEKIGKIIDNIKIKFLGERIFYLPSKEIIDKLRRRSTMWTEILTGADCNYITCVKTCGCELPLK